MRLLFTSFNFFLTLVIGAIAFALTAIEFPGVMRELIAYAQKIPGHMATLGMPDNYMVWIDVLLTGDKLVLLGFVMVTRIVFAMLGYIFPNPFDRRRDRIAPDPRPSFRA